MFTRPFYTPANLARRFATLPEARQFARRFARKWHKPVSIYCVGRYLPVLTVTAKAERVGAR